MIMELIELREPKSEYDAFNAIDWTLSPLNKHGTSDRCPALMKGKEMARIPSTHPHPHRKNAFDCNDVDCDDAGETMFSRILISILLIGFILLVMWMAQLEMFN